AEQSIDEFLAARRTADAAAVLETFVAMPEHRHTRARTEALRGWGERMRVRGDIAAARSAHARAYTAAQDLAAERAVLGDLVHLFHEQWSWDQLATLCALLDSDGRPGRWT